MFKILIMFNYISYSVVVFTAYLMKANSLSVGEDLFTLCL